MLVKGNLPPGKINIGHIDRWKDIIEMDTQNLNIPKHPRQYRRVFLSYTEQKLVGSPKEPCCRKVHIIRAHLELHGKRSSTEVCIGGACNWSDLDTVLLALLLGWLEGDIHQCLLGQSDQPFEQSNRNSFVIILSFMQTSSKSPLCPALLCITMYNHQLFHIPAFVGSKPSTWISPSFGLKAPFQKNPSS